MVLAKTGMIPEIRTIPSKMNMVWVFMTSSFQSGLGVSPRTDQEKGQTGFSAAQYLAMSLVDINL